MISFITQIESLEEGLRIPDARMPFRVDLWEQFYLHSISVKFLCFLDGHNSMMLIFQWYVCFDLQISRKVKPKNSIVRKKSVSLSRVCLCFKVFVNNHVLKGHTTNAHGMYTCLKTIHSKSVLVALFLLLMMSFYNKRRGNVQQLVLNSSGFES